MRVIGLRIGDVVVNSELWARARSDEEAIRELRTKLDGVVLYEHLFPIKEDEEVVTIERLEEAGIVRSVTIWNHY